MELTQQFSKSNPSRLLTDLPSSLQWRWPLLNFHLKKSKRKCTEMHLGTKKGSRFILVNPLTFISQFCQSIFAKSVEILGWNRIYWSLLNNMKTQCVFLQSVCVCCYATWPCIYRYTKKTRLQTIDWKSIELNGSGNFSSCQQEIITFLCILFGTEGV